MDREPVSRKNVWLAMLFVLAVVFSTIPNNTFAAVRTWDGGGADGTCGGLAGDGNKWSCALNWSDDTTPTSSDSVVFDGTSTKDATIDASFQGTVIGMTVSPGYTGTITQARTLTINGSYSQADGTFTGGTSNIDINDGSFSLTSGIFTAPSSGTFTIERNFTKSGSATFTDNGGTVTFDDNSDNDDTTITCTTSVTFTKVVFTKDNDGDFTVGPGCTIPLGAAPSSDLSTGTMVNNGTITVASGTWTLRGRDNSGVGPGGGSFTNNGTITHSGSDWFIGVNFTNGSSGVVTYVGSTVTAQMNFNVSSGTFPSGLTTTFTDYDENDDTTLTCGSVTFTQIIITKDSAGNFIISSGCTVPLGAAPTSRLSTGTMTNAGTITVASGTWNFLGQDNSGLGPGGGAFTNNGTITHSGDGWVVGVNFTNGSSGIVTYGGSTATFQGNLNVSSGTFPSALTATFTDYDENDDTTLTCGSVTFTLITITKDSNGSVTISSDCTVPLGAAPTSAMSGGTLTNNGTLVVDSGTWTITGSTVGHGTLTNNGTITHNGNGWINQGAFINGSSGVVTYAGFTATVWGALNVSSGTFPSGLTLTIGNNEDFDDTTLTCGSVTFAQLTLNKASNPDFSTFTLGSSCTITGSFTRTAGVVSNPSSAYTLFVGGNFSMSTTGAFGGSNLTIELNGTGAQTIAQNAANTFSSPFIINKSSGTATLTTNLSLSSTLAITQGTFSQGTTFNLTTGGATTVGASGIWTNTGTGDITLAGNVSNAGTITLDGSGVGCGGVDAIILSDAGVTQRTWSGAGTFTLQDLDVSDMAGSMTAISSTNTANNSWTFVGCNTSPTAPSSLGSAGYVDGSWDNDNTPTLTFTLSDPDGADTVQFTIQIDDNSDFSSVVVHYTSALAAQGGATFTVGQVAGSGSYTAGSSGQTLSDSSGYYWRVKTIDNSAGESSYSTANSGAIAFKVDTVAPTAGTLSKNASTTTYITVEVVGDSDALSGLTATPYNFENATLATSSGAQADATWLSDALSPDTEYTFQVTVSDLAGNSATSDTFNASTEEEPSSGSSGGSRRSPPSPGTTPPNTEPTPPTMIDSIISWFTDDEDEVDTEPSIEPSPTVQQEGDSIINDNENGNSGTETSPSEEPSENNSEFKITSSNSVVESIRQIVEKPITKTFNNLAIAIPLVASTIVLLATLLSGVSLSNYITYLLIALSQFLGLKKAPKPWGTVYDSHTKRPLPFTRVEILNDQSRKLESAITDQEGRYGFLAAGANMELKAYQKNYVFPSVAVVSDAEKMLYPNTYKGGVVPLVEGLSNFDIPMDPINPSFTPNLYPSITSVRLNTILSRFADILFVAGVILIIVNLLLSPKTTSFLLLGIILLTFILRKSEFKLKPFGLTKDVSTVAPLPFSLVALHDKLGSRVNFTVSDGKGRYFLLTPKGRFTIKAYTPSHIVPMRQKEMTISTKRGWVSSEIGV